MGAQPRFSAAIFLSLLVHAALIGAIALVAFLASGPIPSGGGTIGVWIESPEGYGEGGPPSSASEPRETRKKVAARVAPTKPSAKPLAMVQKTPQQPKEAPSDQAAEAPERGKAAESAAASTGPVPEGGSGVQGAGGGVGEGLGGGSGGDPRLARIWRKINASKYYPTAARRRGLTGMPRVTFAVGSDGSVQWVRIATSCDIAELDAAALETVRRAAPLPAYPKPITLVIRYSLNE